MPTRKVWDPGNTHEKKIMIYKIPTKKNLKPTKYLRENILDPRNTHGKNFWTHESTMAPWCETHETHDGTRPTDFSTLKFRV